MWFSTTNSMYEKQVRGQRTDAIRYCTYSENHMLTLYARDHPSSPRQTKKKQREAHGWRYRERAWCPRHQRRSFGTCRVMYR